MNASTPPPSDSELPIRSLRYFVAVAEELHFTRAAARLFVAQQALSRDIRQLEVRLGTRLFVRSTRRVTLTPQGERLLQRARELLVLHDGIRADFESSARPVVVDLLSEGRRTGPRILEAARILAPQVEFRGRYGGGVAGAIQRLVTGELDVILGRLDWLDQKPIDGIERQLVRLEAMAMLLPAGHPLAEGEAVPMDHLRGLEIDANPADRNASEWSDVVAQFLAFTGAHPTAPHVAAIGLEEQAHHLVRQGLPILTAVDHIEVPGGLVRPLVDPVPLYPWSLAWRHGSSGDGIKALRDAAEALGREEGWLAPLDGATDTIWLPQPEAARLARGEAPARETRAGD